MKNPLDEGEEQQCRKRQKQRRDHQLIFLYEIGAHGPDEKQQSCANLQNSRRPILDGAMRSHGEDHQRANANTNEFHRWGCSPDWGTETRSSIDAEPPIWLSNFALGRALPQRCRRRTSFLEFPGSAVRVDCRVPGISSVPAAETTESPMGWSPRPCGLFRSASFTGPE